MPLTSSVKYVFQGYFVGLDRLTMVEPDITWAEQDIDSHEPKEFLGPGIDRNDQISRWQDLEDEVILALIWALPLPKSRREKIACAIQVIVYGESSTGWDI